METTLRRWRAEQLAELEALRAEYAWLRLVLTPLPPDRRRRRWRVLPRVALRALREVQP